MNARPTTQFLRPEARSLSLLVVLFAATSTYGQERAAPDYPDWKVLEQSQEMIDYRSRLREGAIGDTEKAFLTKTALPQLAVRRNQPTIDRIRRRMREVLCSEKGSDPKTVATANQIVADFMIQMARDADADMVARINAVMFLGELLGGAQPWAPAVAPLAAALTDDGLPPAVRIAAAAGLARHVDADPAARAADAGPALVKVVEAPLAGVDPVAASWLRSRSLAMLARMEQAAPAGTVAAASRLLLDASQPIDLRVRAAAAVGACVKAAGDTDAAAAVAAIRALASTALGATTAEVDRRALAARLAGGNSARPDAATVGLDTPETAGTSQAYRRDAWRLATLADALAPPGGSGGLASVAGATAATATALAQTLRAGAGLLDAQPDADSLATALANLAAAHAEPAAAAPGAGDTPPPPPAADEQRASPGVDGVPFGG